MDDKDRNPNLYIIAGPNGAGKTTFVKRFLPFYAHCLNFVNADLIALDSWLLFDNSGDLPHVVAKETDGLVTVIDNILFANIRKNVEGL